MFPFIVEHYIFSDCDWIKPMITKLLSFIPVQPLLKYLLFFNFFFNTKICNVSALNLK